MAENEIEMVDVFARETMYFNAIPLDIVDRFHEMILKIAIHMRDALSAGVTRDLGNKHAKKVDAGCTKVMEALQTALDLNLDKFELYVLSNIFYIPPEIDAQKLLQTNPANDPSSFPDGCESRADLDERSAALDMKILDLRKRVAAAKFVNTVLTLQKNGVKDMRVYLEKMNDCARVLGLDLDTRTNGLSSSFTELAELTEQTYRSISSINAILEREDSCKKTGSVNVEMKFQQHREETKISSMSDVVELSNTL